jgi:hypothetical protein
MSWETVRIIVQEGWLAGYPVCEARTQKGSRAKAGSWVMTAGEYNLQIS